MHDDSELKRAGLRQAMNDKEVTCSCCSNFLIGLLIACASDPMSQVHAHTYVISVLL